VGLVNNPVTLVPVIETQEHIDAALKLHEKINGGLMGPIFRGEYPAAWLEAAGDDVPEMEDGDMAIINQPGDFLGLNLYSASFVRAGDEEPLPFPKQFPQGDLPWINIVPQTLYWQIRATAENFGVKSFFITENGSAFADELTAAGEVLDLERRELLRNYLIGLHRASAEGYDVQGYFAWSVMDNYEWAEGYVKRFGLIYVDYETQKRTPKLSAQWYSAVAQANRIL
jgi:beta-glucosidase